MGMNFFDNDPLRPETNKSGNEESRKYEENMNIQKANNAGKSSVDMNNEWVADKVETESDGSKRDQISEFVKEKASEEEALKAGIERNEQSIEELQSTEEVTAEAKQEQSVIDDNIKRLSAYLEDNKYDIPAEAKLKHKVDGEEVEVTVQELLNNYSGKQSWEKRFNEVSNERRELEADLNDVNNYVSEFAKISQENPIQGLEFLAKQVGMNPLEYRKHLRQQLLTYYSEYLNMDENQRTMFEQREELDYLRREREAEAKLAQERQASMELQERFNQVRELHQIDDDRMNFLKSELEEYYKVQATPENIAQLHNQLVRLDRSEAVLEKINPELKNDDQKVLMLENFLAGNPQTTDEQLLDMAQRLFGKDVQKVQKEVKRVQEKEKPAEPGKVEEYKPRYVSPNRVDFF